MLKGDLAGVIFFQKMILFFQNISQVSQRGVKKKISTQAMFVHFFCKKKKLEIKMPRGEFRQWSLLKRWSFVSKQCDFLNKRKNVIMESVLCFVDFFDLLFILWVFCYPLGFNRSGKIGKRFNFRFFCYGKIDIFLNYSS